MTTTTLPAVTMTRDEIRAMPDYRGRVGGIAASRAIQAVEKGQLYVVELASGKRGLTDGRSENDALAIMAERIGYVPSGSDTTEAAASFVRASGRIVSIARVSL